jgi:hypothetical protein
MTTSGTTAYNPSLGEVILYAFNICDVRPTAITQEHMQSARTAANLLLAGWSNLGVNLWEVQLVTQTLTVGTGTYNVDPSTIMILDAYVEDSSSGQPIDRLIFPVSRSEYASYANKTQQGAATVYWFDRLINPTITLWPVPNDGTVVLKYYVVKQIQDANFTNGQTLDVPYRWLDAFANGMAYRLARIWNKPISAQLKIEADESYKIAADQDTEYVSYYISPMISGYYR